MKLYQIEEPEESVLNKPAIGIDLGTTNSLIAYSCGDELKVIEDNDGSKLMASVIGIDNNKIEVGNKHNFLYSSIKRLMGRSFNDLSSQEIKKYNCFPDQNNNILIEIGNKKYNPVEISSIYLSALKKRAEDFLNQEIIDVVITVPAYFDEAARNDTKFAAKLAGLNVIRLINEPTAAAFAYGLEKSKEGIYIVYDLGGGTFDVSMLKIKDEIFQVIATKGDVMLGGDDFDVIISKMLDVNEAQAKKIKEELSEKEEVNYKGKKITRDEFEKAITELVRKTLNIILEVIDESSISENVIDGIILVGGATKVPLIKKLINKNFSIKIYDDVNPDEVVALGAALQAENLLGKKRGLLLDVVPLSLGLELMGGIVEKIILRNSPIPIKVTKTFTTYQDYQNAIKLHILQGEREMAKDLRSLAFFELKNLPPTKAGFIKVDVTFEVDENGLLSVTAYEKHSNTNQKIDIFPSYGITESMIEEMVLESKIKSKEDLQNRILIEAKNDAISLLKAAENFIKNNLIEDINKKYIETSIENLKTSIENNDRILIIEEKNRLIKLLENFN